MIKKEKKTHRFWNILRLFLCLLLLIVEIALIFRKSICSFSVSQESNHYQITEVSKEKIKENGSTDVTYDFSSAEPVSVQSVLKAQTNSANLPVIGGTAVPDVGINLPIFKGLGNTELSYGTGAMKESQVVGGENNYTLANHHVLGLVGSSKVLFSLLENAKVKVKIYLAGKSTIYTYVVTEVESVTLNRSDVINDTPGQSRVALITYTDQDATERIIVRGDLESSVTCNEASDDILEALEYSYNQMTF